MADIQNKNGIFLRMEKWLGKYFSSIGGNREMATLSWKVWLKRLPICSARSIPTALALVAIMYAAGFALAWVFGINWKLSYPLNDPIRGIYLTIAFAIIIGSREARYPEGAFKPTLAILFKCLKTNWIMVLLIAFMFSIIVLRDGEELHSQIEEWSSWFIIIISIYGISEMKAMRTKKIDEKVEAT